jgi:hypothetical protein
VIELLIALSALAAALVVLVVLVAIGEQVFEQSRARPPA